jgi:hypothetical protein
MPISDMWHSGAPDPAKRIKPMVEVIFGENDQRVDEEDSSLSDEENQTTVKALDPITAMNKL